VIRAFDHLDATVVLGVDDTARQFSGDSAILARAVLEFFVTPHDRGELLAHLAELSGAPVEPTDVIDQLLRVLYAAGALRDATTAGATFTAPARPRTRLVLGITGAVATAHAPALVSALQRRGFEVRVAATRNALRFATPAALESLTHATVHARLFQGDPTQSAPHIQLAEWADAVVVCPATATTISRLAHGVCSDVVSATAIATRAPVVVVPSMNPGMYAAASVQRNLEQLRADGMYVVHTSFGGEVAHRPDARAPVYGVAPPFDDVAEIVAALLRLRKTATTTGESYWQHAWVRTPVEQHAWSTTVVDEDIVAALDRCGITNGRFLDVGTGAGVVAVEAARRGFDVVATDIAQRALEIARERATSASIAWVHDDVLATRVQGLFELVHDRGCLHVLPRERHADYVAQLARWTAPGACVILKVHSTRETTPRGVHRFSFADVASLFGDAFDVVSAAESVFHGTVQPPPRALTCILRRREAR
jgi:2-polyprenyl-3-methyl-5-hydroxy-6-metoxy-1,4-benzoquinol methylase/3-polyprenyl-4-hydroxybenzoate decarboxylase